MLPAFVVNKEKKLAARRVPRPPRQPYLPPLVGQALVSYGYMLDMQSLE